MPKSKEYQRHIDGLRAVAVLSVVFYHYGQQFFSGGFVGVDVFFVISGYLISKLILTEIADTGDFNFKRFYIRRIRRLFPALAVTLIASGLCALILLSPEKFQSFGRSLAAAVFSVSNIQFWLESGYFDANSLLKPLLHTWSLSVEEQFYLLWPAILWLFSRGSNLQRQFAVLAVMGIVSFALNYWWVNGEFSAKQASAIFYLTPFRVFELVIGGMAVFAPQLFPASRRLHETTMALGLALIAYAVWHYNDSIVFPYLLALPPCLGAFLVIVSRESRIFGWLLRNRIAVGFGLISYSLYLVHWPVLVFYKYYSFGPLNQNEYTALFFVSVTLATIMYFFVEKPFRKNSPTRANSASQKQFVYASVGAMLLIGAAGLFIGQSNGQTPFNAHALTAEEVHKGKQRRFKLVQSACSLRNFNKPRYCKNERAHQVLVLGNSHEVDGFNIFSQVYGNNPDVNLISFGSINDCKITFIQGVPDSKTEIRTCSERLAKLSDSGFISSLDGVIYSANRPFAKNQENLWGMLKHLRQMRPDMPIVVLGGYINTVRDCTELHSKFHSFAACKKPLYVSYNPLNEETLDKRAQLNHLEYFYISKTHLLCQNSTLASCLIKTRKEPAFYDKHHLSLSFATYIGRKLANVYGDDLERWGFPKVIPRKVTSKSRSIEIHKSNQET